jgi:hypothetical protein
MRAGLRRDRSGLGSVGNADDGRAPMPATMNIDYVHVWK